MSLDPLADLAALQGRIALRADRDPAFRQALLSDPPAAIKTELGIELPADLKIKVVEQDTDTLVLILPRRDSLATLRASLPQRRPSVGGALSLDDLDQISAAGSGMPPPPPRTDHDPSGDAL